ncbi:MAG: hypothetical protein ACM3X5_02695 [Bacillota bacterium]
MPRPFKHWKVLPHGPLEEIEEGILSVTGDIRMPLGTFKRRMTIVRLEDRRLVIYSAIALDEERMAFIESYGLPAFLVVPSDMHRLDARIWKERYPLMQVVAPEGAREKVEQVVHVDTTQPDFGDSNVRFITVWGVEAHEAALVVLTSRGTTLIVNDILGNIHDADGVAGWLLRKAGFAGDGPQVPRVVKMKIVDDIEALGAQLDQWAEIPSLSRIIVSHGDMIEDDPRGMLRGLARSLQ